MTPLDADAAGSCPICGAIVARLTVPAAARSMLSDGRVVAVPLAKMSCLQCGLASHIAPVKASTARSVYGENYALSAASPAADMARARAYGACLDGIFKPPGRVLEIGCGSGNLLKALETLWPSTTFCGIDPALPASAASTDRITYLRHYFDELPNLMAGQTFDLIISVNVIEHIPSPQTFFALASALLAPTGQLAVVCPASDPPNLELLFHDHLNTFTSSALARVAQACGLTTRLQEPRLPALGDFQLAVFSPGDAVAPAVPGAGSAGDLARARQAYLHAWSGIDNMLLQRMGGARQVAMFGAGQMAALLRCYAPRAWNKVDLLLMDDPADAWQLGKPVAAYSSRVGQLADCAVIMATAPQAQARVAIRLADEGLATIRFDDVISH